MAVRTKLRPSPEDEVPLHPAYGYRLRRQRHPIGVRGGPRRAPRGYRLAPADRHRVRSIYDLRGRQLARALVAAAGQDGDTAENLTGMLEQRLDTLVHRAGFARSLHEARNLVGHNHVSVDGGKVNRPSYLIEPGQTIEVRQDRQCRRPIAVATSGYVEGAAPPYLEVRSDRFAATLTREPQRQEVPELRDAELTVHAESGQREVIR